MRKNLFWLSDEQWERIEPHLPTDDRPHHKRGDKNANTTYAAVGRALTQWEYLEAKLAELFSQLVGGEWPSDGAPYHPAVRAYGSVLGSAARLTMIEEAAKAHFEWYPNPALQKRLEDLIGTECRKFAGKRNNIAHGIVDTLRVWRLRPAPIGLHFFVHAIDAALRALIGI